MVRIEIQGLKEGKHQIVLSKDASEIEGIFPEFEGVVTVEGTLMKIAQRLAFSATISGTARLVCDYSLQKYTETVSCPISMSFSLNTELFLMNRESEVQDAYDVVVLREDEKFIDITEEVAQELSVHLPLKRLAPEFRDKELKDIVPEQNIESEDKHSSVSEQLFGALKDIHLNN